jgi:ATP-dependent DNA helicase DinG
MLPLSLSRFLVPGTDPDVAASYAALAARALDAVWGFEEELAFLDVETTGFDSARDRVIEVAVIVAKGPEVLDRFSTLVDPGRPIPRDTTLLTGIDDAAVAGAPPMDVVVARVADVIGKRDVVAHNAAFDRGFIAAAAGRAGRRIPGTWLDSLQLARIALPRLRSHRLRDLAEAFGLPPASHRAADDTEALFRMWRIMLCGLDALPAGVVGEIAQLAPRTDWPIRGVLSHHAAGGGKRPAFDLKRVRTDATRAVGSGILHDADGRDLTAPSSADVLGEFAADGAVGRMYEGFESREEQVRMAEAVLEAFGSSRHLAVEAGTGVGKSVAYLVPAARFALDNHVGVGVATKTNSLMDQLVYGELPALSEAMGGELRYVSLKGYEHYPCMRKLDRVLVGPDETDEEDVAAVAGLLAWVAQSAWGDLDAVNIHWRGGYGGLKREVSCSVEDCTHKRCRFYPNLCYLHGVRRRAATAHIVVTNHALLFRDAAVAGGILPPLRYWVVDEAHAAESEARKQMSMTADQRALTSVLRALHAEGRGGAIDAARMKARALALRRGDDDLVARLDRVVSALRGEVATATTISGSFFDFLKDLAPRAASGYDREELRVTEQMREEGGWGVAAGVGASLARRLENVLALGRELLTLLEESGEETGDARADLAGLVMRVADQAVALATVLDGADETFVYSIAVDRRPDALDGVVAASKLDVGQALAESFYPNVHSVVFTSATIAAGEDFGHFARCVGLDRLGEDAWRHLRLTSSYDFDRQMAVFVPTGLPEPREAGYHQRLAELLTGIHRAVGGAVLTLFTNRRDMRAVYDLVAEPLESDGLRVLIQERGASAKRLRDEFIGDERLSLFALKSFWEGFDAKGDTLRCVVVPKLPFGKMTDPLYEERQRRHRDAWELYYLPEAILELKQAAGRLIRSSTDEGCVILADSRLLGTKGYARRFLEALPVSDVEVLSPEVMLERVRERFGR